MINETEALPAGPKEVLINTAMEECMAVFKKHGVGGFVVVVNNGYSGSQGTIADGFSREDLDFDAKREESITRLLIAFNDSRHLTRNLIAGLERFEGAGAGLQLLRTAIAGKYDCAVDFERIAAKLEKELQDE